MSSGEGSPGAGRSPSFLLLYLVWGVLLALVWGVGFGVLQSEAWRTSTPNLGLLALSGLLLGGCALAWPIVHRRLGFSPDPRVLAGVVVAGALLALALVSLGNGLTDEWATTPRYLYTLLGGKDFYAVPTTFQYVQVLPFLDSVTRVSSTYDNYLPLATFLQVPYLDYRYFAIGCWAATVYLLRRNFYAALTFGQPLVAVLAANGFNDFVTLLLLTLAFVTLAGRESWVARAVALGVKQFANVFEFAYFVIKKDARGVVFTLGVSVAFLLPFLLWNAQATICNAVLASGNPSCLTGHTVSSLGGGFFSHMNYWLWPVWAAAVYHRPLLRFLQRRLKGPTGRRVLGWIDPSGRSP